MTSVEKLAGSERKVRRLTMAGGVLAATLAIVASPAGMAWADDTGDTGDTDDTPSEPAAPRSAAGDAVGRPALDNPAPGIRVIQFIGDAIFNQSNFFNKFLDDSPLGATYHDSFGTPNYEDPSEGTNGAWQGILNPSLGDAGDLLNPYDLAQMILPLPGEADLPTLLPARGVQAAGSGSSRVTCNVSTGGTTLSAQGSC